VKKTDYWSDLAERVVRTFIQAALAVVTTDLAGVTDLDSGKALLVAAAAAGLAAVVGLVGRQFGDPDSASFVPRREQ
jgi:hypothetical protein